MGIEPTAPGWTKFQVCPRLGNLSWAETRTPTPHGTILVRAEAGPTFTLTLTVPQGAVATVYLPAKDAASVTPASAKMLRMENGRVVIEVPSGSYRFESRTN
jgi:hypothetical protein